MAVAASAGPRFWQFAVPKSRARGPRRRRAEVFSSRSVIVSCTCVVFVRAVKLQSMRRLVVARLVQPGVTRFAAWFTDPVSTASCDISAKIVVPKPCRRDARYGTRSLTACTLETART